MPLLVLACVRHDHRAGSTLARYLRILDTMKRCNRLIERWNQRIANAQIRKAAEIPVTGPKLLDTVPNADGSDARIMDCSAGNSSPGRESFQGFQVMRGLAK